ncbi:ABC transporter permease [Methylomonas methanica]|uniref:ABC-type transporter, integral membrane subunit n=1 Tax=Methylomonas methanica (strain DSM 25384 / MC09) TaxID=857087 RepID=F9ZXS9_METMM|nr:ABC transporter permease [Methylomonas methanica]AEG02234.1 ABC-type transporter, integral membrane subunit [Methylomonas methanica MC09]
MLVLWTDALIYFLVVAATALVLYMSRQEHMRRPLKKIAANPVAMASLTMLLCYVLIGLADSIHFKDSDSRGNKAISLLDVACNTLRKHKEKTYSAPFATHSYAKETLALDNGSTRWGYPRLQYGGAHLADPETEWAGDVFAKTLSGFSKGGGLMLMVLMLAWGDQHERRRALWRSASSKAVWAILFLVVSGCYTLFSLSDYYHVLGTDKVGEDVFYQTLKSIRTGLVIGSLTTLVMLPLAIVFGIMAGYFKGWVDDVIQFIYTTLNSIPNVLLIAASILMVQVYMANHPEDFNNLLVRADMRLLFLCLILGVTNWTGLCRLLRAETLKLREMEYVLAAQALGVKSGMILFRHILPNVMHIVLISVVLDFSSLVLAEAVLSYINIGVDPTTHSWGNMINSARLEMAREPVVWWSLTAAFVFMFALVLAANLFADSVRDAFDPRRAERG